MMLSISSDLRPNCVLKLLAKHDNSGSVKKNRYLCLALALFEIPIRLL